MIDGGTFQLKTAAQLFEKLERDYERVKQAPLDSDEWFNFFVTADHLAEWYTAEQLSTWDPTENAIRAGNLRNEDPAPRICNHLSRNSKHYKAEEKKRGRQLRISSVAGTATTGVIRLGDATPRSPGAPKPPSAGFAHEFWLRLSPDEAREMGVSELAALDLADRVVTYWHKRLRQVEASA